MQLPNSQTRGAKTQRKNKTSVSIKQQKDATDQLQSHLKGSTNNSHQTATNSNTHPNKRTLQMSSKAK